MYINCGDFCVRDISDDDAESYYEIFTNPEVARYDDFEPISRADLLVDMARIAGQAPGSLLRELAVALPEDDKMIGVLTLEKKRLYTYIGYHFNPDYQGRGYALRSVVALINSLGEDVQASLRLVSDPENHASVALAEKAGFVFLKRRKHKGVPEVMYVYKGNKQD